MSTLNAFSESLKVSLQKLWALSVTILMGAPYVQIRFSKTAVAISWAVRVLRGITIRYFVKVHMSVSMWLHSLSLYSVLVKGPTVSIDISCMGLAGIAAWSWAFWRCPAFAFRQLIQFLQNLSTSLCTEGHQ